MSQHFYILRSKLFFLSIALLLLVITSHTPGLASPHSELLLHPPTQSNGESPPITRDEVNQVARELWCPLCSGVRLDACELKACDQMREEIAIQLEDGASTDQIKDYFLAQYGPQVMGEPPWSGFNLLAWLTPVVVLILGALYLLYFRQNQFQSVPATVESLQTIDEQSNKIQVDATQAELLLENRRAPDPSEPETSRQKSDSHYEQLLEEELKRYDQA